MRKDAKLDSKKLVKAAKSRRVTGVPVRSGVKAGRRATTSPFEGPELGRGL